MIGSHNSYTYLDSVNGYNQFAKYWRCQTKTIQQQLDSHVRFFDIRIKEQTKNNRKIWRVMHGIAELDKVFSSLTTLCAYFKALNVKFRIILEGGSEDFFRAEVNKILPIYKEYITEIVIKKDWTILYQDWKGIKVHYYSFVPWKSEWSIFKNIKHFLSSTIKNWAAEHNPAITQEMIDDEYNLYFMDYI